MSYILDALKRAESERGRGAVPNIHAQPDVVGDGGGRRAGWLRWGTAAGVTLVLLLGASAGAWWWSRDPPVVGKPAGVAVDAPAPTRATPPLVARPAPAMPPAPEPFAESANTPTAPRERAPGMAVVPPARTSATVRPGTASAVARLPARESSARVEPIQPAAAASVPQAPPAVAGDERVYAQKDLPDDIRSSLPALAVGGATYSENPSNRMLIVNGALFHEGDKLAPEVTLQQIKLRSAVLSYRGYRYVINY